MQLHVTIENGVKNIIVDGRQIDSINLYNLLNGNSSRYSITFLDADIIEDFIIDRIAWLQSYRECRIYVLQRYLYFYLKRLGLNCSHIVGNNNFPYSNPKKLKEKKANPINDDDVLELLYDIKKVYSHDYTNYQLCSIRRLVKNHMARIGIDRFKDFKYRVVNDKTIFQDLIMEFSINTTKFFRNPEEFYIFRKEILPFLASLKHFKIWCAGCSIGKEPYSLAIMLEEYGILDKAQIYATDINPYAIQEAINGLYTIETLESDEENYSKSGGTKSFSSYFHFRNSYMMIKERLKRNILFFNHNVFDDGLLDGFHLILCRNLIMYFNNNLQENVLKKFYHGINPQGFLALGKCESLINNNGYKYFKKYNKHNKIYIKRN